MEWTREFRDIGLHVPEVGGKNASLGEMLRELAPLGVRVPDGFAITAEERRLSRPGCLVKARNPA